MVHAHVCGGSSGDSDPAATSDHVRRRRLRADAGGGVDAADIARMGWCTRATKDFLIRVFFYYCNCNCMLRPPQHVAFLPLVV